MEDDCFREGLVRFLIGMSISMRQDIVNATMTHVDKSILIKIYIFSWISCCFCRTNNEYLRRKTSGDFVLIHRNRGQNGWADVWYDYSMNDYR